MESLEKGFRRCADLEQALKMGPSQQDLRVSAGTHALARNHEIFISIEDPRARNFPPQTELVRNQRYQKDNTNRINRRGGRTEALCQYQEAEEEATKAQFRVEAQGSPSEYLII